MESHPIKIFVSYTQADRAWAEWIAWQLEDAVYETILQAWHFQPGSNFVHQMHQAAQEADRTIAVLSPAYAKSGSGFAEWATAFALDPTGVKGKLVPVQVETCDVEGLLGQIVYISLVNLDQNTRNSPPASTTWLFCTTPKGVTPTPSRCTSGRSRSRRRRSDLSTRRSPPAWTTTQPSSDPRVVKTRRKRWNPKRKPFEPNAKRWRWTETLDQAATAYSADGGS